MGSHLDGLSMVDVGGHATRVLDVGVGDPVVLLHGWGGRIESMAPVARCLEDSVRVLALDLPGFGESPAPTEVWGSPEYGVFVAHLLRDRGIERAHMVGHSFGAKTALQIAASRPQLVDKLVIVGASGLRTAPSWRARAKRALSRGARAAGALGAPGRRVRTAVYSRTASQDYKDAGPLRPILVKTVNEDLSSLLPHIGAPTLVVWGSDDDAVPLQHGWKMAELIPDSGLVVFEGAGHFAYLDEPARFCRIIRNFFGAPDSHG